jgi:sugar phosphate isomerase/epimerase
MNIAISTRWNASRHTDGFALVEEIQRAGATHLELGYDTRVDLLPGIKKALQADEIQIDSVHNYCPVPMSAPRGHPELWTFVSPDPRTHEQAVQNTLRTMQFAQDMGANIVVIHCGYAHPKRVGTGDLMDLIERNLQNSRAYEKTFLKFLKRREKASLVPMDQIRRALDYLLPHGEQMGVALGLENLPTLEAVPNEEEMLQLLAEFPSPALRYWHDLGHAQIRENLGYIHHLSVLEQLRPFLGGMHLHDVAHVLQDHVMPPNGDLGLQRYRPLLRDDIPLVIEPSPRATFDDVSTGMNWIQHWWNDEPKPVEMGDG